MTSLDELLRVVGPDIRHERTCSQCRKKIDAKHLFCPYCGAFKHGLCSKCHRPMEPDWKLCAFCGTERNLNVCPL